MRFTCASCGQRYEADESFAGEEIECAKCEALISIPNIKAVSTPVVPQSIKISIPDVKKKSIDSAAMDKVEVPKLKLPASFTKKTQDNKTAKAPSLTFKPQESSKSPSLAMSVSTNERLGDSSRVPSLGMSASTNEKLGDFSRGPSLAMSASTGEKLRG